MKEPEKKKNKSLDPQLWHACAGSMVHIPPVNSTVFYFPQGHAEHAHITNLNLNLFSRIPPLILCRVASLQFLADPETDQVFATITLVPTTTTNSNPDNTPENSENPTSFAKTLTQSDANNGGGFSVPRYCAETIFPKLDYSAEPPVQTVSAKDIHGQTWKFRHIYRGTPRRHLLTTGWSNFVNHKKLIAGDSVVFLRSQNGGDLRVGIRRSKRWPETGWAGNNCGGGVMEAVRLAASGEEFEIVYYPRGGTPEFCVEAKCVREAMRVKWCGGMRFKMAFESEDSCRISWFMGTIDSVKVVDPMRWPNSPWRLLQVSWDEPDLLQNVKRVSPWLVELVSNMPPIHFTPFSTTPRKKLRLPDHSHFALNSPPFSIPTTTFSGNPLCCLSDNAPAGIQGARHTQFGISLSDLQVQHLDVHPRMMSNHVKNNNESLSCLLTMGNSCKSLEKSYNTKRHPFWLFGQPILTEQQISRSCSSDNKLSQNNITGNDLLVDENRDKAKCVWGDSQSSLYSGQCQVFRQSEDVGRTLDLSRISSYEELYRRLANMFGMERSGMLHHVLYCDATGAVKKTEQEPFSDFMKTAKRLTILTDSGSKEF